MRHRKLERLALLATTEIVILGLFFGADYLFNDANLYQNMFWPSTQPSWDNLFKNLLLLAGVPIALLLWLWRDRNIRDQIESQNRQINLTEFQDVQMRLAGALDPKVPEEARATLETAALYQLADFMHGAKGLGFRRPAFELLRARLEHLSQSNGAVTLVRQTRRRLERLHRIAPDFSLTLFRRSRALRHFYRFRSQLAKWYRQNIEQTHFLTYRTFTRDELKFLAESGFPVSTLKIHGFSLHKQILTDYNLEGAQVFWGRFHQAVLDRSNLGGANLQFAQFSEGSTRSTRFVGAFLDGASFFDVDLEAADFANASMIFANISGSAPKASFKEAILLFSRLAGAKFHNADFSGADLRFADLTNTDFRNADLTKTNICSANLLGVDPATLASCEGAIFDDETLFHLPNGTGQFTWDNEVLNEMRQHWRAAGARHRADPVPEEAL